MNKFDFYRKKTFTSHWNNFSQTPKNKIITLNFIKKIKKHFFKIFGYKVSIRIIKNDKIDDTFTSYQTDPNILKYRNKELENIIFDYLKYFNLKFSKKNIAVYIDQYNSVYYSSPIKDLQSGFGFNEGLFLFCLIKVIKPTLIIESGIMKGFTTYLIEAASSKDCLIKCYDINFENVEYKSSKAVYINHDIQFKIPDLKNHKVLAFWDDHTSQLDRLLLSLREGIKYNIFDDDLSFLNFHSDGWPPIPTISMLKEVKNKAITKKEINWVCRNKLGKLWLNSLGKINPINQVSKHKIFPDLFHKTGYKNHSQCSFLITK